MSRNYYRLMLGPKSVHAQTCFDGGFIGTDFGIALDLTDKLPDDWRASNAQFIPVYLAAHPDKTKIGAGLACAALWTVGRGMHEGDLVLCPDGKGSYHAAEVVGGYVYAPGQPLPHRRPVRWLDAVIPRSSMSEGLQNTIGSISTLVGSTALIPYGPEIEHLLGNGPAPQLVVVGGEGIEDAASFVMEKHLEEFLVSNWPQTELGKDYTIYEEDGEKGQQYQTDTGPLDILAISKDKTRLLVVELKKGRASDAVVGQTLRYMSYVQEELAEPSQTVHGAIIALEDDLRLRRALSMTPNITFYRYQVSFKLVKM